MFGVVITQACVIVRVLESDPSFIARPATHPTNQCPHRDDSVACCPCEICIITVYVKESVDLSPRFPHLLTNQFPWLTEIIQKLSEIRFLCTLTKEMYTIYQEIAIIHQQMTVGNSNKHRIFSRSLVFVQLPQVARSPLAYLGFGLCFTLTCIINVTSTTQQIKRLLISLAFLCSCGLPLCHRFLINVISNTCKAAMCFFPSFAF